MVRLKWLRFVLAVVGLASINMGDAAAQEDSPPNIVFIYADDLGYGDIGCYGATRIPTPNLDRLAKEGLLFRDAHSPAATCTPSRFALMTGQYAFRKPGTGVLPGNADLIIEPGQLTLPLMLKRAGYITAVVGKWHLGLGRNGCDWNGTIAPGPLEIGFDYAFIIPATGDRVPCVYVENHHVVGLDPNDPIQVSYGEKIGDEPTGREHPELLKYRFSHGHDGTIINGISRIGFMKGGKSARWVDEDMADVITQKAVSFIESHKDQRFFLYFATHDIHVPRLPHPRFVGKSQCGLRGDAVVELDWCVGQILDTLDRLSLTNNTLVIFSSDNGPVVDDGYHDGAVEHLGDHRPSGPFRGGKYSAFEGGTRVPMIVRWPNKIAAGTKSDALVCHIDFLASFAALVGQSLPEDVAIDSVNVLPALLGKTQVGREELVEQAGGLALRQGNWKYIPPRKGPAINKNTNIELGVDPNGFLFNLENDPGEQNNLISSLPDKAKAMAERLQAIRDAKQGGP
ncbi:MAG: arylsulfatase [Thermogutta sp.]|nr:arylsulfatase [Thermogutta sp.]HQF13658.1 arylsulfatase [Thermogutta sp.]